MTDAKHPPEGDDPGVSVPPLLDALAELPVVLWTTDVELRMISSGGGAIALTGDPGSRVGLTLQQILGSDDPAIPAIRAHLAALEGESSDYDQSAFGHVWQSHVAPILDEERGVVGVAGVAIDVTGRRAGEGALRESEARLDGLLLWLRESQRAAQIGSYELDIASETWRGTEVLYEIVGLGEDDPKTVESWVAAVHPDDREEMVRYFGEDVLGRRMPFEKDYRVIRKSDGQVRWVFGRGELTVDEAGLPVKMVGTIQDITERKLAEEEIRRHAVESAALTSLAGRVGRTLSLEEVAAEAVEGLGQAIGCDVAFLFLREGERLLLKGVAPESARSKFGGIPEHRVGMCLCGLAVHEGEPLFSRDIFTDARCAWDECKEAGLRSFAALPLQTREGIIGVIGVASETERDFEERAPFLETLAGQVASGLQNAMLFAAAESQHEEASRSERWLRALLQSISDVVLVLDYEGMCVEVTSGDPDLLYRPAHELKGKMLSELYPPELAELFLAHVRRALSEQATVHCDYQLEIGGRERWFSAVVSPLSETQVVGVARDITERKGAELALERGEAKFRALFEAGAEAFVLVRADGIIDMVNRRAEAVFGYPREELEGQPLDMLVPEGLRAKHAEEMRSFVENPRTRPMNSGLEIMATRKDGTTFPADISLSYVTTEFGVLAMAAITDETERKRAEDHLRESLKRLRESDAERGRLLASLVVAQEEERGRMARELHDDAIQVMTAAELRLQTFALKNPPSRDALNALGETIQSSIGRLRASLIGLRPPILENVGVAPALRAHMESMREHSGTALTVEDLWEREPGIETRVTVYRIVLEALNNAMKYADATSVDVTLKPVDGGFGAAVRDNGKGFDTAVAEAGAPGHMGLMIMRERAELAGGKLEIVSRPGGGTTVEFWVPDLPEPSPPL